MQSTIEKFYHAFGELDAEKMVSCYAENVVFEDPAFGILKGEHAKNMWRMLCESQKGKDFKVVTYDFIGDEKTGSAHWEAFYTFSQTGRKVHNKINAHFEFENGLIVKHTDSLNLHAWAKQAMGFTGFLLGGTSFFKKKLHAKTTRMLQQYEARKHEK
jgi:ketosteroid isomerase-like protein